MCFLLPSVRTWLRTVDVQIRFPLTNVLALSIGVTLTVPPTFDITLEELE